MTSKTQWANGLIICVTGFNNKFKESAKSAIVDAGGSYTPSLSRRVTHLVVAPGLDKWSEKLETARKKTASGAWKVACVSVKWLQLCVLSSKLHPTDEYSIHSQAPPGPSSGLAVGTSRNSQPAHSNTVASVVTGACSTEPASCLQTDPNDELDAHGGWAACSSRASISRATPLPTTGGSPGSHTAQDADRSGAPGSEELATPQIIAVQSTDQQAGIAAAISDQTASAQPESCAGPSLQGEDAATQITPGAPRGLGEASRTSEVECGRPHQRTAALGGQAELPVTIQEADRGEQCCAPHHTPNSGAGGVPATSAAQRSKHGLSSVVSSVRGDAVARLQMSAADTETAAAVTREQKLSAADATAVATSAPNGAAAQPIVPAATGTSAVDASLPMLHVAVPGAPEAASEAPLGLDKDPAPTNAVATSHQPGQVEPVVASEQQDTDLDTAGPSKVVDASACPTDPVVSTDGDLQEPSVQPARVPSPAEARPTEPVALAQMKKDLLTAHLVLEKSLKERLEKVSCPAHPAGAQQPHSEPVSHAHADPSAQPHATPAAVPADHPEAASQSVVHRRQSDDQEAAAVQSSGALACPQRAPAPRTAGEQHTTDDAPQVQAGLGHGDLTAPTGITDEPVGLGAVLAEHAVEGSSQRGMHALVARAVAAHHASDKNGGAHAAHPGPENVQLVPGVVHAAIQDPGQVRMQDASEPEASERPRGSIGGAAQLTTSVLVPRPAELQQQNQTDLRTEQAAVACSTASLQPVCQEVASARAPAPCGGPATQAHLQHSADVPVDSALNQGTGRPVAEVSCSKNPKERTRGMVLAIAAKTNDCSGRKSSRTLPLHKCAAIGAAVQKKSKKERARGGLSAVAQATAQQQRVFAAAAQRAEHGVLGGCGEIVSGGPLQPPWCLYWSDGGAPTAAPTLGMHSTGTGQGSMAKGAGQQENEHSASFMSPGALNELKERVNGLSAAVDRTRNQKLSRVTVCSQPTLADPKNVQCASPETFEREEHAVRKRLMHEAAAADQLLATDNAIATLKKTCAVLDGEQPAQPGAANTITVLSELSSREDKRHSRLSFDNDESRRQDLAGLIACTANKVVTEEFGGQASSCGALAAVLSRDPAPQPGPGAVSPVMATASCRFDAAVAAAQRVSLSIEPRHHALGHEPASLNHQPSRAVAYDGPTLQALAEDHVRPTVPPGASSCHGRGGSTARGSSSLTQPVALLDMNVAHDARVPETGADAVVNAGTACTVQPLQGVLDSSRGVATGDLSTEHRLDVPNAPTQDFIAAMHMYQLPQPSSGQHRWPGVESTSVSTDLRALMAQPCPDRTFLHASDPPYAQTAVTQHQAACFGSEIDSFEVNRDDGCHSNDAEALLSAMRAQRGGAESSWSARDYSDLGPAQCHFNSLQPPASRCKTAAEPCAGADEGGSLSPCEAASADAYQAPDNGECDALQKLQGSSAGLPIGRGDGSMVSQNLHSVSRGQWDLAGRIARAPAAAPGGFEGAGSKGASSRALGVQLHAHKRPCDDVSDEVPREELNGAAGKLLLPTACEAAELVAVPASAPHSRASPEQASDFNGLRNAMNSCRLNAAARRNADAAACMEVHALQSGHPQQLEADAVMHAEPSSDCAATNSHTSPGEDSARNLQHLRGALKNPASSMPVCAADDLVPPTAAPHVPAAVVPRDACNASSPTSGSGTARLRIEPSFTPPEVSALKAQLATAPSERPLATPEAHPADPEPQVVAQLQGRDTGRAADTLPISPSPLQDTASLDRALRQSGTESFPQAHTAPVADGAACNPARSASDHAPAELLLSAATPLAFNTQHEDLQSSPAATDDDDADTPRLGVGAHDQLHTCPAESPRDQTPSDTPVCDGRTAPPTAPHSDDPAVVKRSDQGKKRLRGESSEPERQRQGVPPSQNIVSDTAVPALQHGAKTPSAPLGEPGPCQSQVSPSPEERIPHTPGPTQANDDTRAPGVSLSAQPAARTPAPITGAPSVCDASQGCSAGSVGVASGGSSGGGGGWRPGSVIGGLMGALGSMGRKRSKISPTADSLPVVAPPRLLEGINWRLNTDFAAQPELKGQMHEVVLRCPTVTLIIPRCTSAWRACLHHSTMSVPASPAEHTAADLATQLLGSCTPEMQTQVEAPGVLTPATVLRTQPLVATQSVTHVLREVTNTQSSAENCDQLSQPLQHAPGFSQGSLGRVVGFTQVPESVGVASERQRAGKVSVVLESERRAFSVEDVLQAVRGALADVKGSGSWVFDGLHKTSAAGKQPVVYETVFML